MIADKIYVPKNAVLLRLRKDMNEDGERKDSDIPINLAYESGIVSYSVKYSSVVPDFRNKVISKEKLNPKVKEAVMIVFPFTRPQRQFIHNHDL